MTFARYKRHYTYLQYSWTACNADVKNEYDKNICIHNLVDAIYVCDVITFKV